MKQRQHSWTLAFHINCPLTSLSIQPPTHLTSSRSSFRSPFHVHPSSSYTRSAPPRLCSIIYIPAITASSNRHQYSQQQKQHQQKHIAQDQHQSRSWIQEANKLYNTQLISSHSAAHNSSQSLASVLHPDRFFFEGWYVRITDYKYGSFAFMYSLEKRSPPQPTLPNSFPFSFPFPYYPFQNSASSPYSSQSTLHGIMQVLPPHHHQLQTHGSLTDALLITPMDSKHNQPWASQNWFGLGHWNQLRHPPHPHIHNHKARLLSPHKFHQHVLQGFQLTARRFQGSLTHSARWDRTILPRTYLNHTPLTTVIPPNFQDSQLPQTRPVPPHACHWDLTFTPVVGWGDRHHKKQRETATILAHLPIMDPGYQVVISHGFANGYINWHNKNFKLDNAALYIEKNWGVSFPPKWFWVQCNSFPSEPDLTLTTLGAIRWVAGFKETVGIIAVHYKGILYEFSNIQENELSWSIAPWGSWNVQARTRSYKISMEASTESIGTWVMGPTANGMQYNCRDASDGHLVFQLHSCGQGRDELIVRAQSSHAAVEVGGGPWEETWQASVSSLPKLLRNLILLGNGSRVITDS